MTTTPQSVVESRSRLLNKAPFFACILYDQCQMRWVEDGMWRGHPLPTACCDGLNIVVNLPFFDELNIDERVFVLAHEIYHAIAMHPKRMRTYQAEGLHGKRFSPKLYNIAADTVINFALGLDSIGKMPMKDGQPFGIDIKKIGDYQVTGMELAEDIYEKLYEELPPQAKKAFNEPGLGDPMDGQGIPGMGKPGQGDAPGAGDIVANSPDKDAEGINEGAMKAAIQSAAEQAKAVGNMPAGLKRLVEEFLEHQVPWEEILRAEIMAKTGRDRETWSKPKKRHLVYPGIYMPKRTGMKTGQIAVAIDTSGSVSQKELQQFLGEVACILGDMQPEQLYLIWCDAAVDGVEELDDPEELRHVVAANGAGGGGGTSFIPPFEWVKEQGMEIDTFIYCTDGYGPFPTEDQAPFPTIWCISSDVVAPFGTTIRITY